VNNLVFIGNAKSSSTILGKSITRIHAKTQLSFFCYRTNPRVDQLEEWCTPGVFNTLHLGSFFGKMTRRLTNSNWLGCLLSTSNKIARSFVLRVYRHAYFCAVILGLVLLTSFQCIQAQSLDRIERERALLMLGVIKNDLKNNYYDPQLRGLDFDAKFKAAEEKIKQATSLGQAFGSIAQVLLDLNDSHTIFIPPQRPERIEYGWNMQMIGEKCYVVAVKPGSDAERQGLKIGDEVNSVEGFRPTRKEMWKMDYYYRALSPRRGLRVVAQSPGGEPRQLDIAAKVQQGKRVIDLMKDWNELIREAEAEDRLDRHRFYHQGDIVIWKMPNFNYEPEQVDSLMSERVSGKSALVLDLRGNPGGYVKTVERLVGHFFDHDLKIADRKGRKELKPSLAKSQGQSAFKGKLIVLIDSKSGSAAEVFARLVQLEKRGIVIGDRSAGAVMESRSFSHELGTERIVLYGSSISHADVIMSDGKSVEYVGVTPDELLLPTPEDMAAQRDPVLARAMALAGGKISPEIAGKLFPLEWRKLS
jgi:C-terminal processing protease CtpA/Prc